MRRTAIAQEVSKVDDAYRVPMKLEPGEVPADLLARLGESQHGPRETS